MPMRTRAWEDTVGYWTRFKWFTAAPINALQCAVQQIILGKLHKTLSVLWHWGGLSMYQFHQPTCFSRQAGTLSGIMRWFCTQFCQSIEQEWNFHLRWHIYLLSLLYLMIPPFTRNPQCTGTGRGMACDQAWTSLTQFSTHRYHLFLLRSY